MSQQSTIHEWRGSGVLILLGRVSELVSVVDSESVLTAQERARLQRISHAHRRGQFLAARLLTREAGRRWFGPNGRIFSTQAAENGAPKLCIDGVVATSLHLSLSHADDRCAVVVADQSVGIDVQGATTAERWAAMSSRVFAQAELRWIRAATTPDDEAERYARIWSLKEAHAKQTGLGLRPRANRILAFAPVETDTALAWSARLKDGYQLSVVLDAPNQVPVKTECVNDRAAVWSAWTVVQPKTD